MLSSAQYDTLYGLTTNFSFETDYDQLDFLSFKHLVGKNFTV